MRDMGMDDTIKKLQNRPYVGLYAACDDDGVIFTFDFDVRGLLKYKRKGSLELKKSALKHVNDWYQKYGIRELKTGHPRVAKSIEVRKRYYILPVKGIYPRQLDVTVETIELFPSELVELRRKGYYIYESLDYACLEAQDYLK